MYKCSFIKLLWKEQECKRLYKTLEKDIELAFPPQIGYEITEGEWFSGKVERVVWDNKDKKFSIKIMDVKPKEGVSAELLLDIALKQGWSTRDSRD
jgi:hypothetical protein